MSVRRILSGKVLIYSSKELQDSSKSGLSCLDLWGNFLKNVFSILLR
jgi:hypothetical protein